MKGVIVVPRATASPFGWKSTPTPLPTPVGREAGFANLAPNPEEDHAYAFIYGVEFCPTTTALFRGWNDIAVHPVVAGSVDGLAYFVPNPEDDHGYAVINGVPVCVTITWSPVLLNAMPLPVPAGNVAGSENFEPNPDDDQAHAWTRGVWSLARTTAVFCG
jgi:hypothetical protein